MKATATPQLYIILLQNETSEDLAISVLLQQNALKMLGRCGTSHKETER